MPTIEETVAKIVDSRSWDQRIAQIRLVPQHHGIGEQPRIYAEIARALYLPHLAPDFAYIHEAAYYGHSYFEEVYGVAARLTGGFQRVAETELAKVIRDDPRTLLIFRTIVGLTKDEFAHSTELVGGPLGLASLTKGKIDSMEQKGTRTSDRQAQVAAMTLSRILDGSLFGEPPGELRSKQSKPDTERGWDSVRDFARDGVPFESFLHQRHYGGAFGQILNATSAKRGNLIEDAVESLFKVHGIPYIRTGSHNQKDIADRFEVIVTPAPDFVVFDTTATLRGMLECKGLSDGGTAKEKAPRFRKLKDESTRLGGVPLIAVLGGIGWTRVQDGLGPVIRDTDGRVFTVSTLSEMLSVSPFPSLLGLSPKEQG